jgi:hypothetical protein
MENSEVSGVQVGGREPKALLLNDGTRLALEEDGTPGGRVEWTRIGDDDAAKELSVAEALELAGSDHARYVKIRTRSEVEWLHIVAEWYREQADRLALDLAGAYR